MERVFPVPPHDRSSPPGAKPATRRTRAADVVRWFLRRHGWDVRRFSAASAPEAQLGKIVRHLGIRSIIDVGAGTGEFAISQRRLGFDGTIVSFEPYSSSHARLEAAARGDPLWHVMPAIALGGAERRAATLRIASNADSSSLFDMLDIHREAAPGVCLTGSEAVDVTTLDLALGPRAQLAPAPSLLKLDTQGSELQILQGARATLARIAAVHIELSLVPLYANAPLARDVLADPLLVPFDLWAAWPSFVRASDGRTLQADALLVRRPAGPSAPAGHGAR